MTLGVSFTELSIVFTKDGDMFSDGEIFYHILINDQIKAGNGRCLYVPDGSIHYPQPFHARVPEPRFKVEFLVDEFDWISDDVARQALWIDLSEKSGPESFSIRARHRSGRLDCTLAFTVMIT